MTKNKRAVHTTKARAQLQHMPESFGGTRLLHQARRHSIGDVRQTRRAGQKLFTQREDAGDGFDHARRAERVAEHSLLPAHRRTDIAEDRLQRRRFHGVVGGLRT